MKPKRIILIRHGESVGNKDPYIYEKIPDYKIPLTEKGLDQAAAAGESIKGIIGNESVQFYVSPYLRTRQTVEQVAKKLDGNKWLLREDPRLREQDFGQMCSFIKNAENNKRRIEFGHFFFRVPEGESGADVFDRVSTFYESMFRDFLKDDYPENTIIGSHGITIRVLLMRYYHWTVEYFESMRNPFNCQMFIMQLNDKDKYDLISPVRLRDMEIEHPANI